MYLHDPTRRSERKRKGVKEKHQLGKNALDSEKEEARGRKKM